MKTTMFNKNKINYKYNEDKLLKELSSYIDGTYDQHYSLNKYQSTEFIIDSGHGEGFLYWEYYEVDLPQRYGKRMVK